MRLSWAFSMVFLTTILLLPKIVGGAPPASDPPAGEQGPTVTAGPEIWPTG